ncbi:MAG TPA: MarR family winged helix-turn-helix transcriptional regulator [Solirubrobacteraceae bacterium]|nr:MarR family winged helix-turn-helix transcriptional regulator [Solirubrobacteraceae bacterium]
MSTATATATVLKLAPGEEQSLGEDGLSEAELRAWRGLLRAHASLAKRLESRLEREHGLQLSSYEVLQHLVDAPAGRMRMCDLAEQAQLSRSGLTRLVDRLERDELLGRCTCEHDARGAYACLTEQGRERLSAARGTHRAVVREHFLSHFSEHELETLGKMWDRVTAGCCGASAKPAPPHSDIPVQQGAAVV